MNSYYEKIVATGEVKCIDEEIPFDIPQGWEWTRLSRIVYNHGQKAPDEVFSYIDIGSIDNVNQKLNSKETILNANEAPSRARRIIRFGDIIYSTVRPYLHNTCIIDRTFLKPAIASTGFAVFACHRGLINKYLFNYLLTPQFDTYANDKNNAKGVAYPAINDEKLYKALVPVPPTNEQNRIINIIEQLSPYVSRYSETASVLKSLNTQLGESLKRSILQQAIQGKLVSQTAADGTAQELLEQIKKEKQKLVKEGKLKKKDLTDSIIFKGDDNKYYENNSGKISCIDDEIPFEIPSSWAWVRLGCIYNATSGGTPEKGHPEYYCGGNILWAKVGDLKEVHITNVEERITQIGLDSSSAKLFPKGTLLVAMYCNDAIGKSSIIDVPMSTNQAICGLYPNPHIVTEYVYYVITANKSTLQERSAGGAQKNINQKIINQLLIPLPPVKEQQRIVNKILNVTSIMRG